MWTRAALAFALACAAGGCASKATDQAPAGRASSDAPENEPYMAAQPLHPHHAAGEWAVAVVGTPFYWVFKSAVCVGSVAVAAPTSAVVALGGYHAREEGLEILGEGVAQNCGPPWVLSP